MGQKDMYAWAMKVSQGKFHGTIDEKDNKLYFNGTVASEADKNAIWDAIKTIPTWRNDIVANINVDAPPAAAPKAAPAPEVKMYTVQAGDTLSGIAKSQLGHANDYMKIFEANKDQLTDPDKIKPGQILRIP